MGARLISIGRTQELKHVRDSFDKDTVDQLMQDNLEKGNKLRTALDLVDSLQNKLTATEGVGEKLGEKKAALEARLIVLSVEKKQLETKKEDHGLEMFAAGFERVVEQAKLLVPGADLSAMDLCKVVVGDELVDDDDGVEGEGENPNV
ncbi:uncharacterized protein [Arachis hypogaea]|uniref:uncharacterized protein n=1 Tax=Arachis hypogaea TaxID=3818 RepID=UPI0007AFC8F1